jgi:hypothetical protein
VIAAALAVAGCAGADDRPSDWDYIHAAIIVPSCATAGCHGNPLALAGLDFSGRDGTWTFLTGRVCGAPDLPGEPRGNLVLPGQPERSTLMHRLRGQAVDVMPPSGPLPAEEIALIERWILEGAPCE